MYFTFGLAHKQTYGVSMLLQFQGTLTWEKLPEKAPCWGGGTDGKRMENHDTDDG
jgi:hypothetical protein